VFGVNLAFWILVLLGAVALWCIISFIFIPLGRIVLKKWNKLIEILDKEDKDV